MAEKLLGCGGGGHGERWYGRDGVRGWRVARGFGDWEMVPGSKGEGKWAGLGKVVEKKVVWNCGWEGKYLPILVLLQGVECSLGSRAAFEV